MMLVVGLKKGNVTVRIPGIAQATEENGHVVGYDKNHVTKARFKLDNVRSWRIDAAAKAA